MFILDLVIESLASKDILEELRPFLITETKAMHRIPVPMCHVNEYCIPEIEMGRIIPLLESRIKPEWYIYALDIDEGSIVVILTGKSFKVSGERDICWHEMVEYGVTQGVDRLHLENLSLVV